MLFYHSYPLISTLFYKIVNFFKNEMKVKKQRELKQNAEI